MRLLAGTAIEDGEPAAAPEGAGDWSRVVAGEWLATTLAQLRAPRGAGRGQARGPPDGAPSLPGGRRPLALVPLAPRPGRLPGRRHGTRQDDPGAGPAPPAEDRAGGARREAEAAPAPATEPPRGAGVPDRQLAAGDRAVRARSRGVRGPPVGAAESRAGRAGRGGSGRRRSRHHDLRAGATAPLARRGRVDPARSRRGPGDQEPRRQAGAGGQAAPEPGPRGPDGHADREPARRSLVAVRLPESRAPGERPRLHARHPGAGGRWRSPLRAAPGAGAAVHPAPAQDRPPGHHRPAGQDRDARVLPPHPEAGRPLPAGGEGARAPPRRDRGDGAARHDPRHPPAPQADLQPSLAVARRRRLRARPEREVRPTGRAGRGAGAPTGEGARVHPVPRDDRPAVGAPRPGLRPGRPGAPRPDAGEGADGPRRALPDRRDASPSSCCPSGRAGPGST